MSVANDKLTAMLEHRHHPLSSRRAFLLRFSKFALFSAAIVGTSLGMGMVGYRTLEGMPWLDAFLNAAMILGGMGPVDALRTSAGKIFAGSYALYSGIVFIASAGLIVTPIFHRLIHRFHIEAEKGEKDSG
jgi:hypothetical protein